MALFQGTINQIENNTYKIDKIEKSDSDGKQKQYSSNNYPTVNAVTEYVEEEIAASKKEMKEKLDGKAVELKSNIDAKATELQSSISQKADTSALNEAVGQLQSTINEKEKELQSNINSLARSKADKSSLQTEIDKLDTNKLNKSDIDTELNTESENPVQNKKIAEQINNLHTAINSKASLQDVESEVSRQVLSNLEGISDSIDQKLDNSNLLIGTYEVDVDNVNSQVGGSPLFTGGSHATQLLYNIPLTTGTYYLSYMIKYDLNITVNEDFKNNSLVADWENSDIFNVTTFPNLDNNPDIYIKPISKGFKLVGKEIILSNDGYIRIVLDGSVPYFNGEYKVNGPIDIECSNINIIKL